MTAVSNSPDPLSTVSRLSPRSAECEATQRAKLLLEVHIKHQSQCLGLSTTAPWFLVGNGGMGYWDYYRGP